MIRTALDSTCASFFAHPVTFAFNADQAPLIELELRITISGVQTIAKLHHWVQLRSVYGRNAITCNTVALGGF